MPRPRKPSDTQLSRHISFRVSEAFHAAITADASEAGLGPNELARLLTMRGQGRLVINTTRQHDPAFIAQVHRIGLNLNQLVKSAHLRGSVSPLVDHVCAEIQTLVLAATQHKDGP